LCSPGNKHHTIPPLLNIANKLISYFNFCSKVVRGKYCTYSCLTVELVYTVQKAAAIFKTEASSGVERYLVLF